MVRSIVVVSSVSNQTIRPCIRSSNASLVCRWLHDLLDLPVPVTNHARRKATGGRKRPTVVLMRLLCKSCIPKQCASKSKSCDPSSSKLSLVVHVHDAEAELSWLGLSSAAVAEFKVYRSPAQVIVQKFEGLHSSDTTSNSELQHSEQLMI